MLPAKKIKKGGNVEKSDEDVDETLQGVFSGGGGIANIAKMFLGKCSPPKN